MANQGDTPRSCTDASKLARLDELRQMDRQAAVSRVASVIGHVIGTPLHVIVGRAGLIRESTDVATCAEHARRIESQVSQLAERVRQLIDALTAPEFVPRFSPADSVLREAFELYQPIAAQHGVALVATARIAPTRTIDAAPATVVLTSLLSLAIRKATPGTEVLVGAEVTAAGVEFSLAIPRLDLTDVRIDRLEPPAHAAPDLIDPLQVLAVCFAVAHRYGGTFEVARAPEPATVRFGCLASDVRQP